MFEKLFRRRPRPVVKFATNLDPKRIYFSGLLIRFDEGFSDATLKLTKLNPRHKPDTIPTFASESEKGAFAARSLVMALVAEAMGSQDKLWLGRGEVSIFDGAIGISYGLFILIVISNYLENEGVKIDYNFGNYPEHFAQVVYVFLDDAGRKEVVKTARETFQHMIESNDPNIKKWHDDLSKTIQLWLISATSHKRTKDTDRDLRELFASHLGSLYRAMEKT